VFVLAVAVVAAAGALLVASDHQQRTRFAVRFDPHKEAKFERTRGDEASRNGADNPVAEQVADRAYPRSYVDDRLAVKSRDAFKTKPATLGPSAFATTSGFSAAQAASPGAWRALGRRGLAVLRSRDRHWPCDAGVGPRHGAGDRPQLRQGVGSGRRAVPPLGRCRGRRDLAHQQCARCAPRVDRAAGEPADERLRLADRRRQRRERQHALRRFRRAERLG